MKLIISVSYLFFFSACLPPDRNSKGSESESSRALIDIDGSTDDFQDQNKLPNGCRDLLRFKTSYDGHGFTTNVPIATKKYEYKKDTCVHVYVGTYEPAQRVVMRGQSSMGSRNSSGNFELTARFMNKTGISCEVYNDQFSLIFPVHDKDEDEKYKRITLGCSDHTRLMTVTLGLFNKRKNKLAVTVSPIYKKSDRKQTFHAFDTNREGEIVKYIKVVGAGGQEELLFER